MKPAQISSLIALLLVFSAVLFSAACVSDGTTAPPPSDGKKTWIVSDVQGAVTADMNISLKDDFHAAVNQEWLSSTTCPPDQIQTGNFAIIGNRLQQQIAQIIGDESITGPEIEMIRMYYLANLDMGARNAAGIPQSLKTTVTKIVNAKTVEELSPLIVENGCTPFITPGLHAKPDDATRYEMGFTFGGPVMLGTTEEFAENAPKLENAKKSNTVFLTRMLDKFGVSSETAQKLSTARFALEKEFAKGMQSTTLRNSPDYAVTSYHRISAEELKALSPDFPIAPFLAVFEDAGVKEYSIYDIDALKNLNRLYTNENLDGFKGLLLTEIFARNVGKLDQECLDIGDEFLSSSYGIEYHTNTAAAAYSAVNTQLAWPLGKVYADNLVDPALKTEITALVEKTILAYEKMLSENTWLSSATKEKAIEKLKAMKIRVAYPDDWSLPLYDFSPVQFSEKDTIYDMDKKLEEKSNSDTIWLLTHKIDDKLWVSPPQTVNAGYSPTDNSINMAAGLLAPPFYDKNYSTAELYGAIGVTIGHEISHAFDLTGSSYDKDGNVANWWTPEDRAEFEKRTAKISEYYSSFEVAPGEFVNGAISTGEATADLGGIAVMLELAKEIDGFDYEKFFRTFGQSWRTIESEQTMISLLTDPHPPGFLRTNVALQQFEEFYRTFNVSEKDGMYLAPEKRLKVW